MSTMAIQRVVVTSQILSLKMASLSRHESISASWIMSVTDPQLSDEQLLDQENRLKFGQFMVHEAVLDEEYWKHGCELNLTQKIAKMIGLDGYSIFNHFASLRQIRQHYKRKYAEQELNALKRRCKAQIGQRCTCIVAVLAEDKNIRHTVLKSVVGTLDLIIGHLSHVEAFPGIPHGRVNAPVFSNIERRSSNRYGYIANLCVAKSSRRQGVSRNMLHFSIRLAKENGAEKVFVHVHTNNGPAQNLYRKVGFEVVEVENLKLTYEQPHLLFLRA